MELIQEADRSKWMVHSNHSIKRFTKGDIDRMTNNYRTSLGSGAFGEVYEGILEDGSMVAVKRFIHDVKENFAKELIVHREINHENVVRLIGYCIEENALMLVTKYIANGNLNDALHLNSSRPIPLSVRLRIAIECAEALAYMHSHMYTQVIHGDIKPANILLDCGFNAKVSDFGISRLIVDTNKTLYTEHVMGSIGYMDPMFARDGRLTVKSDVYSFGVVLFELIARKKATTVVNNVDIVSAFTNALARGARGAREMFDAEIASKDNMKIVEGAARIAGQCLMMEREKRPQMIDVVERLRVLWKASQQDQGQRVDLFSWARKSKPVPAKFLSSGLCRQFSLAEMKAATNNFHESLLVGEGAYGRVYRGKVNGRKTKVAIKRHRPESWHGEHEFRTEIVMSSKHIHDNVLPLLGYCDEMGEMILVYNYVAHGCLRDHLYGTKQPPLNWNQRLEICIGAAQGLHCLHASKIIHGNLATKKILLDEKSVAKIRDLSLSKPGPSNEDAPVTGTTTGYIDPEYVATTRITEKSDVYSFGVVLFEVLCGKPEFDCHLPEQSLLPRALRCKEEGNLDQIIDPYLLGRINPWCLNKVAEIAEKCISDQGNDRPSMADVVSDLEYALKLSSEVSAESSGGLAGSSNIRRRRG